MFLIIRKLLCQKLIFELLNNIKSPILMHSCQTFLLYFGRSKSILFFRKRVLKNTVLIYAGSISDEIGAVFWGAKRGLQDILVKLEVLESHDG